MEMVIDKTKQGYIDWLDTFDWSFWATLTTQYELSMKSGRRTIERYFKKLKFLSDNQCKIFYVLEPFSIKDGMHIHCLIQMPEHFHQPVYYGKMVEAWQMATGSYRHEMDENDKWIKPKQNRVDLQRYKKDISASGYCTKYILKTKCDYDILV